MISMPQCRKEVTKQFLAGSHCSAILTMQFYIFQCLNAICRQKRCEVSDGYNICRLCFGLLEPRDAKVCFRTLHRSTTSMNGVCRVDQHEWTFPLHAWVEDEAKKLLRSRLKLPNIFIYIYTFIFDISFDSFVPPNAYCNLLNHVQHFFANSRNDSNRSRWMNLAPLEALVCFFSTPKKTG